MLDFTSNLTAKKTEKTSIGGNYRFEPSAFLQFKLPF